MSTPIMELKPITAPVLDIPTEYIQKVEAAVGHGILTLKNGKRYRIDVSNADISHFTQKDWLFVANKIVVMLVKKQILQQPEFDGAVFSRRGIEDLRTHKLVKHNEGEDTRREYRELEKKIYNSDASHVEDFIRSRVRSNKSATVPELSLELKTRFHKKGYDPLISQIIEEEKRKKSRINSVVGGLLGSIGFVASVLTWPIRRSVQDLWATDSVAQQD